MNKELIIKKFPQHLRFCVYYFHKNKTVCVNAGTKKTSDFSIKYLETDLKKIMSKALGGHVIDGDPRDFGIHNCERFDELKKTCEEFGFDDWHDSGNILECDLVFTDPYKFILFLETLDKIEPINRIKSFKQMYESNEFTENDISQYVTEEDFQETIISVYVGHTSLSTGLSYTRNPIYRDKLILLLGKLYTKCCDCRIESYNERFSAFSNNFSNILDLFEKTLLENSNHEVDILAKTPEEIENAITLKYYQFKFLTREELLKFLTDLNNLEPVKRIKSFKDMYENKKEDLGFNSSIFMEFIKKEMDWNGARIEKNDDDTYLYTCYPGSSVIPELKEAGVKFGVKLKVNRTGDTSRRAFDHEYIIKVLDVNTDLRTIKKFKDLHE